MVITAIMQKKAKNEPRKFRKLDFKGLEVVKFGLLFDIHPRASVTKRTPVVDRMADFRSDR